MKIIRVSNYDNEAEAERLVADNIQNEHEATIMCLVLQEDEKRSKYDWFRIVPDTHVLWRGMEDLV